MPGLHLPRTPYDLFVSDFPHDFSGIVGGYGLWRLCLHCIRATCDFLYGLSARDRDKAVRRWCEDSTEIVESSCSLRSLRTEIVRSPCVMTVRSSCSLGIRVLKVYNFTFPLVLSVGMATKTKGGKGKRFKRTSGLSQWLTLPDFFGFLDTYLLAINGPQAMVVVPRSGEVAGYLPLAIRSRRHRQCLICVLIYDVTAHLGNQQWYGAVWHSEAERQTAVWVNGRKEPQRDCQPRAGGEPDRQSWFL